MTLEQALQRDCPYKPHSADLFSGQSLSKCIGLSCMCWVEITEPTYINTTTISGTSENKNRFLKDNPNYEVISSRYNYMFRDHQPHNTYTLGMPVTEPRGYCTLRGDI